ncbi:GNAT family N-acetyltransferase [Dactylosporangium vinaceum]|uniref:GNAT family N-acetyltransferase n=1 Tax=Dactylosporangium vinaceum TaxID=53362 RepID=A0ABV5MIA1_9ACTN|nr:GNAT family N-acetyltransferase [Dactylosporangium vinaceum]UAB97550.1 GNAT family N-acetyltransferase [Dactylosporangium vinaceum]
MLGPQHVGQRVVVRRIVGMRDARPVFSDILGHLLEATETHITVRARTGAIRVPIAEIARAKPVPPRRRFTPTESLESAAAMGWPAREQEQLGDWVLRATDGWTQRANSTLAIGSPDIPLSDAIDFVQRWYSTRSLVPAFSVPVPLFKRLDDELERRGWTANPVSQVMTIALPSLLTALAPATSGSGQVSPAASDSGQVSPLVGSGGVSPDIESGRVELATEPSEEWLTAVAGRKGPLPESARHVLTGVTNVRFAGWYDRTGTLLATARGCVADPDSRWLGLSLIGVDEHLRRRGLAQRLIAALARWAADLGAQDVYLQVEQRNAGAVALYERLGFTVHHAYSSRRLLTD